uniref:Inward rectifier potassium channel 2 n=1 Tax=Cacopsylla melanoneura TaxID=428564 RepID=A0A8D9FGW5_9HEMI
MSNVKLKVQLPPTLEELSSQSESEFFLDEKQSPIPRIEKGQDSLTPDSHTGGQPVLIGIRKIRGSLYRKLRRRTIDKHGVGNIIQINISKRRRAFLVDIFTTLVDIQWRWTLLVCIMGFLLSWFGFACCWWLTAFTHGDLLPENLSNGQYNPCVVGVNSFASSFLFSIETQHTIGYGSRSITTECPEAMWLMCIQSIVGTLIQAFMTGLVFAKMARPKQRTQTLLFSRTAVINLRDGHLCLMFRVGDMREKSHIIGGSVKAYLVKQKTTLEGEVLNPFLSELKLHIDSYDSDIFLLWPTIVVHRIDQDSPLYDMCAKKLLTEKFEIIAILEGTTESTGQTTQAKTSYLPSEILWGHRFEPLVRYNRDKVSYEVDYALFHNTNQVDTPLCSARELEDFTQKLPRI